MQKIEILLDYFIVRISYKPYEQVILGYFKGTGMNFVTGKLGHYL